MGADSRRCICLCATLASGLLSMALYLRDQLLCCGSGSRRKCNLTLKLHKSTHSSIIFASIVNMIIPHQSIPGHIYDLHASYNLGDKISHSIVLHWYDTFERILRLYKIYAKKKNSDSQIFKVQTQKVITGARLHISLHALSPVCQARKNSVSSRSLASFTTDIYTQASIFMISD